MNKFVRYSLAAILFIVALNAFGGGYYGLSGAKDVPLEWLDGTPFDTYFIPGLFLLVVVGGSCLAAATGVIRAKAWGKKSADLAGLIMLTWIIAQLAMIGYVSWLQPAIVICGLLTLWLSSRLHTGRKNAAA